MTTEKGKLIKGILFPPRIVFKFDQHWKLVFAILLFYGSLNFLMACLFINWQLVSWFYGIFAVSQVMSPLIPTAFLNNQAIGSRRLNKLKIYCVNMGRVFACGKLKIFCFDKTGTMTKEGLDFHGVHSISTPDAPTANLDPSSPSVRIASAQQSPLDPMSTPRGVAKEAAHFGPILGHGEFLGHPLIAAFMASCHSLDLTTKVAALLKAEVET
eukprot:Selendium_serpulae@DN6417_c1_g1_i8.p1